MTIIEKKQITGGACIKDSEIIEGKNIDFAYGATVLGMMPEFIFNETGLSKEIVGFYPKSPKLVYFKDEEDSTKIFQDSSELEKELKNKWGEKGRINDFRNDENKVVRFIQKLYKERWYNKTIETISYLARLKIDQSDKENIVKDLDKIIDFIGQLQEINTEKLSLIHI